MGRQATAKGQFNVWLPKDAIAHVDHEYFGGGPERATRTLAGLIALEWCPDMLQKEFYKCAMRVARGEVSWERLLGAIPSDRGTRLEPKVVDKAIELLARQIASDKAPPSRISRRRVGGAGRG